MGSPDMLGIFVQLRVSILTLSGPIALIPTPVRRPEKPQNARRWPLLEPARADSPEHSTAAPAPLRLGTWTSGPTKAGAQSSHAWEMKLYHQGRQAVDVKARQ